MRAPHALIVPFSGQGHVNGCMLLARALCATGFSVSFVYLSSEHRKLQASKRLPQEDPAIATHIVEDGVDAEGEKEGDPFFVTEATKEGLEELVQRLEGEAKPVTCIISDSFSAWTQDVAHKLHLPRIDYWTSTAISYLMLIKFHRMIEMGIFPEEGGAPWRRKNPVIVDIPGFPSTPIEHFPTGMRVADASNLFAKFFAVMTMRSKEAERILIHSLSELEHAAFEAFKEAQIPAFAIGPLLHYAAAPSSNSPHDQAPSIAWLDTQSPSSVIYVAFGSNATLTPQELLELAFGLEATNQPFLWAVRQDSYQGELSDVLPEGFLSRTKDRGLIIGWAPQVEVLAHPSVGGFFSHCGWNSTLESLWAGVPILACPRVAEQRSNAHYISQVWKVGLEVERTDNGEIERSYVEAAINTFVKCEEGERVRSRMREVMQLARETCQDGGMSKCNLEKLYEDMKARCQG